MAQSRSWVFTVNNPGFEPSDLPTHPKERYVVWQLEKVAQEHIQGYIELMAPVKLGGMKKWLPTAHFECRRGTAEEAKKYCQKEDSRVSGPWERGEFTKDQGRRNDLDEFKAAVKRGLSRNELMEEYSEVAAKYPRFFNDYRKVVREENVPKLPEFSPKFTWQSKVLEILSTDPDTRTINWVYDPIGNHGKTYLSKYLVQERQAFYTNGGKSNDLAYAYEGEGIVIFDYVRDAKEFVGYGVIEQLKNGILMSTKYESGRKVFAVPHVFVFANFMPADDKFSRDRLQLMELNSIGQII